MLEAEGQGGGEGERSVDASYRCWRRGGSCCMKRWHKKGGTKKVAHYPKQRKGFSPGKRLFLRVEFCFFFNSFPCDGGNQHVALSRYSCHVSHMCLMGLLGCVFPLDEARGPRCLAGCLTGCLTACDARVSRAKILTKIP